MDVPSDFWLESLYPARALTFPAAEGLDDLLAVMPYRANKHPPFKAEVAGAVFGLLVAMVRSVYARLYSIHSCLLFTLLVAVGRVPGDGSLRGTISFIQHPYCILFVFVV